MAMTPKFIEKLVSLSCHIDELKIRLGSPQMGKGCVKIPLKDISFIDQCVPSSFRRWLARKPTRDPSLSIMEKLDVRRVDTGP